MVIVHSGRNPFAIFLLGSCVLTGISGLITPQHTSPAVAHVLPTWELLTWYGGLLASSSVALGGLFANGLASLLVERVGLVVLASITAMYVAALLAQGALAVSPAAAVTAGFSAAAVARIWQISRDIRDIDRRKRGA